MRIHSIMTGGTVVGAAAFVGMFLVPCAEIRAVDEPATMSLTGTIRDFLPDAQHPDFSLSGSAGNGPICQNVALTLDATLKPIFGGPGRRLSQHWREGVTGNNNQISWCHYTQALDDPLGGDEHVGKWQGGSDSGGITNGGARFDEWFTDVPGVNQSRLWTITLNWGNDLEWGPCWMYDTNNFNPIDNQLQGNDFDEKNFFFTYEIVATFTYDADANQFFWYKGDDDCWLFINGRLVMDHGGIAGSREQTVFINSSRIGLSGLQDGQEYQLRWFIAERRQPQSQFHIKTNVLLNTNDSSDAVLAAYD